MNPNKRAQENLEIIFQKINFPVLLNIDFTAVILKKSISVFSECNLNLKLGGMDMHFGIHYNSLLANLKLLKEHLVNKSRLIELEGQMYYKIQDSNDIDKARLLIDAISNNYDEIKLFLNSDFLF